MPLLNRRRTLLAKIESSYGSDPTPTGAANAILVSNLNVTPMATELVDRDLIRPFLGNSEQLHAAVYSMAEFQCEVAGSGTAGTAPAWGPLMRACGFSETALGTAHTGTAQAGGASTITLAAGASAADDAYTGMTIRTTGGTGSGQSRVISDYVGSTKVATVAEAWTTPPDATTTYSIDAQVVYQPVSQTFESVTIYFNVDGVFHKMLGARGTFSAELPNKGRPVFQFRFTGLYVAVADAATPTVVFTAWKTPLPVNNVNTGALRVHGFTSGVMSQLSIDVANSVVHRSLVGGSEQVLMTDRRAAGRITLEAVTVASKDWWTPIRNAVTGAFSVTHGTTAGNKVKFDAPALQLTEPNYEDLDGVAMLAMGARFVPGASGNDELVIAAL
jgi:hypothetical protein